MISAIVCAPGRIRRHRGSSTPRLPSQFWLGDLHAIGLIFRYAYDGPAEREYHPALWPSRSTDSGQRKASACRAMRPVQTAEARSIRHRRLERSAHVSPFKRSPVGNMQAPPPAFATRVVPTVGLRRFTSRDCTARRHTARIELTLADQSAPAAGLRISRASPAGTGATHLWQMGLGRL